jgi:DNA-binding transcriptional regulator YiaG
MTTTIEPMTPAEYHRLIRKLDLSVYASAKTLGISLKTAQRYANGQAQVSKPVAQLLRSLVELNQQEKAG